MDGEALIDSKRVVDVFHLDGNLVELSCFEVKGMASQKLPRVWSACGTKLKKKK